MGTRVVLLYAIRIGIPTLQLWFASFLFSVEREYHYSCFSDEPEKYLKVIQQFDKTESACHQNNSVPRFGIITHHFLASRLMVEFFRMLSYTSSFKRIVLIGPDHFHHGMRPISFSSLPWKTPFGIIKTDQNAVRLLNRYLDFTEEDHEAFSLEHSMGILVPFVKYYFPNISIVPILIRSDIGKNQLGSIFKSLSQLNNTDTFFLLSMDFSHKKSSRFANCEDALSADLIKNFEFDSVWSLDVDCKAGLYLFLKLAKGFRVDFMVHTNSAEIVGKDIKNCTSYFSIFFSEK